jgi:mRNA-degrading endonuclease HigB of HigAB toxin-antitoxin module
VFGLAVTYAGTVAARAQYDAWLAIAGAADWKTPEDVKKAHPKASVLKMVVWFLISKATIIV